MGLHESPRSRGKLIVIVIAAGAVFAALALIVAIGGGGGSATRAVSAPEEQANVPTREGAIATVARWLDAVDTRQELLDPTRVREAVAELVAQAAQSEMSERLASAGSQLRGGTTSPITVRSAPLGYEMVSYSPQRAVVSTWEVVARGAEGVPPGVVWAHSELTLVWEQGWRISATTVRTQSLAEIDAAAMADLDAAYVTFDHVP